MTVSETRSTCPYCGVGCGVIIESDGQHITGVRGDPTHPANQGRLCTKGSTLHLTARPLTQQGMRLLQPSIRKQRGHADMQAVDWHMALETAADRFADIIRTHGPDAVGFYVSGQLLTEDYYVFNKLCKGLIGTNNIDTNSRLCMSSAVAGYKKTLGADAPPACHEDVNHAKLIFIAGSNTAWAHPVFYRRIEQAKANNPDLKIIVADPRRTDTTGMADLHLQLQPGTDVMLFNGLLHIMLWEGWINQAYIDAHTEGFDNLKKRVRDCTPDKVSQITGVSIDDLVRTADWFANSDASLSLYCQGLNQSSSGTAKNAALINLHLATGQIGKPGAGPFSLTGQPNAMGGREVGGLANLLSAHRDLANAQHRAEVAALWGIEDVPSTPGKTAVEMFEAAARGEIRALWIACTNPVQSMPDATLVAKALKTCELVVVQEAYATTATTDHADILLPATTWGEKNGTVTNSERRISRVRPAIAAPGSARHDWDIVIDFAQRLEKRLRPGHATLFPYRYAEAQSTGRSHRDTPDDLTAEAIWNEHRESTRGRDLDITGLSYALLNEAPRQWPFPEGAREGRERLYTDGQFPTASGRARFADVDYKPPAEARDARYPFMLNTGRLRDQWHGMSRTGTLGRLFAHVPEPVLQMHPLDMHRRSLKDGDLVYASSRRSQIVVPVQGSDDLLAGHTFMAMHWGPEFLGGCAADGSPLGGVNALTSPAFCPDSKQPELKQAAIRIEKADLPWTLLAVAWLPPDQHSQVLLKLRTLMRVFSYASCVPFASQTPLENAHTERQGILFRAAALEAPDTALLSQIETLLQLTGEEVMRYEDHKRQRRRVVRVQRQTVTAEADTISATRIEGFLLAGDTVSGPWIQTLLQQCGDASAYGRLLLLPESTPPVKFANISRQVCSCINVSEQAIVDCLQSLPPDCDDALPHLQAQLRCGTQCGSCVPELKRMIRQR